MLGRGSARKPEYVIEEKRVELMFDLTDETRETFLAMSGSLTSVRSCKMEGRTIVIAFKEFHSELEKKADFDKILAEVRALGTKAAVH